MISDESDRFNPRDPKPADAGKPSKSAKRREARQVWAKAFEAQPDSPILRKTVLRLTGSETL